MPCLAEASGRIGTPGLTVLQWSSAFSRDDILSAETPAMRSFLLPGPVVATWTTTRGCRNRMRLSPSARSRVPRLVSHPSLGSSSVRSPEGCSEGWSVRAPLCTPPTSRVPLPLPRAAGRGSSAAELAPPRCAPVLRPCVSTVRALARCPRWPAPHRSIADPALAGRPREGRPPRCGQACRAAAGGPAHGGAPAHGGTGGGTRPLPGARLQGVPRCGGSNLRRVCRRFRRAAPGVASGPLGGQCRVSGPGSRAGGPEVRKNTWYIRENAPVAPAPWTSKNRGSLILPTYSYRPSSTQYGLLPRVPAHLPRPPSPPSPRLHLRLPPSSSISVHLLRPPSPPASLALHLRLPPSLSISAYLPHPPSPPTSLVSDLPF